MLNLFNRKERRQIYWIFAALVVRGAIEVVGVASIMPFMAVVVNPGVIHSNAYLSKAYELFSFASPKHFLLFLGGLVFCVLVVNNLLAAITDWFLFKFTWMSGHSRAQRLFAGYLARPYSWFLKRNTAGMGANILNEVSNCMKGVLRPFVEMLTKGIVSIFIFIFLLLVDPLLALIVALVLGSVYLMIFLHVRKKLTKLGEERLHANRRQFVYISEAMSGIKDIKMLGCELFFYNAFSKHSHRLNYNQAIHQIVSQIPRYSLELVAFGGILLIVLYFIAIRQETQNIIPLIALYAFAGYRLMPALQGVFIGVTSVRFNLPVLNRLSKDISEQKTIEVGPEARRRKIPPMSLSDKIEIKNIEFAYDGGNELVIKGLDLTITAYTTVGLVGSTGAGKTTLVDTLLGFLHPQKGKLLVDGQVIAEENKRGWQNNIGYVPQHIFLSDDTVTNNIAFGRSARDIDNNAVERAAKLANIHDFVVKNLLQGYDTVIGERGVRLSGGQRQRLGIARALYHDPDILVLDEATSSLDSITEDNVMQAIHALTHKKTIIMIAHRLTTLKECDVIHFIHEGKVLSSGAYDELLRNCPEFRELAKITEKKKN